MYDRYRIFKYLRPAQRYENLELIRITGWAVRHHKTEDLHNQTFYICQV